MCCNLEIVWLLSLVAWIVTSADWKWNKICNKHLQESCLWVRKRICPTGHLLCACSRQAGFLWALLWFPESFFFDVTQLPVGFSRCLPAEAGTGICVATRGGDTGHSEDTAAGGLWEGWVLWESWTCTNPAPISPVLVSMGSRLLFFSRERSCLIKGGWLGVLWVGMWVERHIQAWGGPAVLPLLLLGAPWAHSSSATTWRSLDKILGPFPKKTPRVAAPYLLWKYPWTFIYPM